MSAKRILLGALCLLLIVMGVLGAMVLDRVGGLLDALRGLDVPKPSEPSGSSQPATLPTEPSIPTEPSAPTEPTEPSNPTEPTEPAHEHEFVLSEHIDATCEGMGYEIYVCTGCAKQDVRNFVEAYGHSYDDGVVIAPTCEEHGCLRHTCTRCGATTESDLTDPVGHQFAFVQTVAPTCTEAGFDLYECAVCGAQERQSPVDPVGHQEQLLSHTDPTCTAEGAEEYVCTVCGAIRTELLPMTGHRFGQWITAESGVMYRLCELCGEAESAEAFAITSEHVSQMKDGGQQYVIYVGNSDRPRLFFFVIQDHINNGSLHYELDVAKGLIVYYTDGAGAARTAVRSFETAAVLVIRAEE